MSVFSVFETNIGYKFTARKKHAFAHSDFYIRTLYLYCIFGLKTLKLQKLSHIGNTDSIKSTMASQVH